MFNVVKIQEEIIKVLLKDDSYKLCYEDCGEDIAITIDAFTAYIFPKEKFFVKMPETRKSTMFSVIMKRIDEAEQVEPTNELVLKNGCQVRKYHCEHFDVWINTKFTDKFGKDIQFAAVDRLKPVYVFDNSGSQTKCIGFVCPMVVS